MRRAQPRLDAFSVQLHFRRLLTLALTIAIAIAGPAFSQQLVDSPAPRPRIGLVLGGGGAKGAAHIGVLRVLEELRIPVDCVAGTSMGALVGATFAAGVPPEEIERMVRAIDWSATVGNAGLRDRTPINAKLQGIIYTNNLDLGLRGGQLKGSGGLIESQNIEELLRSLVAGARYIENFDKLPIPFRAVATDMMAGEMVVLGEGDLTVAMRASMAVPGAFSPVVMGDRVLADGGQMRNVPVDIARKLCGDVVIAVSLAAPPPKPGDLTTALALVSRSIDVMIDANTTAQLATLTDKDVSIVVPMGDISSGSFDRVPDAIPLGRAAALGQTASLARYSVSPGEYSAWRKKIDRSYAKPFRVADVKIAGLQRVNPEYVRTQIRSTVPGAEISAAEVAADSSRIFALGDFEKVEYDVADISTHPTVEFTAIEKSWGPDFLRFDLGLAASGGGDFAFALRAEHERTWLNSLGGEWHSALQIGETALIETGLYQPLDVRQRFFVEPIAHVDRTREDVYDDGERVAEYSFTEGYGEVDFGLNLGTRAQLRAGLRRGWAEATRETGASDLPVLDWTAESDVIIKGVYDTRDAVALPTRGTLLIGRYVASGSWLGGDQSYGMAEALALKAYPFRGDALYLLVAGGDQVNGDLPPYRQFLLGGIRTFPGLERQQLRGTRYWLGAANYAWKLADIQSLFGQALYGGFRLTAGQMYDRLDGIDEGAIYGAAVMAGARTPVGSMLLSLGATNNGFWQLQFALGRPIEEGSIWDEID